MPSTKNFIESCLTDAARLIEAQRKKGLSLTHKGRNDLATSADFASEKLIVGRIRKEFPDSTVLSEESFTGTDLLSDSLFVIDPIDGTHNFIQGVPLYGVSVAHYSGGRPTHAGMLVSPQKMLFYSEKGKTATLNGRKVQVSETGAIEDFFLFCDSRLHSIADQGYLDAMVRLERRSQHTRFTGCAIFEMGAVACGMADASLFFKLKPYDFGAAAFIVEQAGGKVTDFSGRRWSLETKQFCASNGKAHQPLLDALCGKA